MSSRTPHSEGPSRRPTGAAAFLSERSLYFARPLRWLSGFAVVGLCVRAIALYYSKESFEAERGRQEARDKDELAADERRRAASTINYDRVWERVFAEEARILADEEEQIKKTTQLS
jgi:hypothetical protein